MIDRIGKITVFVNNQEEAIDFWVNKIGFVIKFQQNLGPTKWIEIAPNMNEWTTLVLYDKEMMRKQNPKTSVEHPSIIFSTKEIDITYNQLKNKGIDVTNLMTMPYGKMFSFYDQDKNPYLIREDKEDIENYNNIKLSNL